MAAYLLLVDDGDVLEPERLPAAQVLDVLVEQVLLAVVLVLVRAVVLLGGLLERGREGSV